MKQLLFASSILLALLPIRLFADMAPGPESQSIYTLNADRTLSRLLLDTLKFGAPEQAGKYTENKVTCKSLTKKAQRGDDSIVCHENNDMISYQCKYILPRCVIQVVGNKAAQADAFLKIITEKPLPKATGLFGR